jgi:hypothetical protein
LVFPVLLLCFIKQSLVYNSSQKPERDSNIGERTSIWATALIEVRGKGLRLEKIPYLAVNEVFFDLATHLRGRLLC